MSTSAQTTAPPGLATRQEWLAILARTPRACMKDALDAALDGALRPEFDWLRAPDIGLAMVRGRVGGSGDAFNLGEVTVTRATLRLRDKERATLAALADALLQTPAFEARMHEHLLAPLAARIEQNRAQKQARAAGTKVEFFTMVRGD